MIHLRIRGKFIAILIIASVLPLTIALFAAQFLSYRYYRTSQGRLYETMAQYLANNLSLSVNKQIEDLDEWLILSELGDVLAAQRPLSAARAKALEEAWPALAEESPEIATITRNKLSAKLRAFQKINPLFVELFVSDITGGVVASTGKTSDYWQHDERWWKRAFRMPPRTAYVEGIHFDESSGVYSIDISLPIYDAGRPDGTAIGVIKGVVSASPLLSSLHPVMDRDKAIREVVLGSGRVLVRLFGENIVPVQKRVSKKALKSFEKVPSGWMLTNLENDEPALVGHASLKLAASSGTAGAHSGIEAMHIVVYNTAAAALAPVRKQMYLVTGCGIVLVLVFAAIGYYIAGMKILDPLEKMSVVVQRIGSSAKLDNPPEEEIAQFAKKHPALSQLERIRTHDELGDLAQEFAWMARRILSYHEHLEAQIAEKTAETQRDLDMAREFQEALMPRRYPTIPANGSDDAVALNFHHIYMAASTVGGDFFDVVKLSDHRAGVFIADVMGHGARSALVTAILRTLIQDFALESNDPATFLEVINHHFHTIVRESKEFIFVSAFYLVIDTEREEVQFASAGHPSPLFADLERRKVMPLIADVHDNPALGLLPDSTYTQHSKSIIPGDAFVLFTDGAYEAMDASGTEFGLRRMQRVIFEHLGDSAQQINEAIVEAITDFLGRVALPDDICLVGIEVVAAGAGKEKVSEPAIG